MKLLKNFSKKELADLQKGQQIMTNMLKEFDNICRTNGLKYWCVGGTLIGAVRHKGWIPHDADIDVAMLKSDYEQLQNIIQKNLSKDYWFQDKSTDKYYKSNMGKIRYLYAQYDDYKCQDWHNGIQLDIFINTLNNDILTPNPCMNDSQPYKYNFIFPLKEMFFEDIKVYVPNELEKYCKNTWGEYPPPVLPINNQYPHEGRISFSVPTWMKDKYPFLYKTKIGYAVGVFDLFHYGHQNFFLECVKRCDKLIIGIHTDVFVESYKRKPIENEKLREKKILSFIKNENIDYETCIIDDNHIKLIDKYNINVIFHGTDWELESYKKQIKYYEFQMDKRNIKIELIDYTRGISTTDIINKNINNVNKKKCFLFDLDNTLLLNNKPMKCACELLKKLNEDNKDIYLITNNNRYSPENIYEKVLTNNLNIKYENIISSLIQVKNYLIKEKLLNIYLWGTDSAKNYLEKNGIKCKSCTDKNVDIVVILYNNKFNYDELSKLCTLVKYKNYIVGNIDPCYPDKNYILPDTGSIIKLIQNTSNNNPLKIFGKPNPLIISSIKEKYTNEEILFIGDSEITDKKLATNCNIDFLRVHKDGDISDLGVLLYILNSTTSTIDDIKKRNFIYHQQLII